MKYLKILFIFIFFFILITNKDVFLRFNYEKYKCESNNLGIREIVILKEQLGSKVEVQTKEKFYNMKVVESSKEKIILKDLNNQIKIVINRINEKISVLYKKNTYSLLCTKNTFRI